MHPSEEGTKPTWRDILTGFPKHLTSRVHDLHFQPMQEEFQPRTMWSLSNAFTSAFKELDPVPQYKATAKLAGFLQSIRGSELL